MPKKTNKADTPFNRAIDKARTIIDSTPLVPHAHGLDLDGIRGAMQQMDADMMRLVVTKGPGAITNDVTAKYRQVEALRGAIAEPLDRFLQGFIAGGATKDAFIDACSYIFLIGMDAQRRIDRAHSRTWMN